MPSPVLLSWSTSEYNSLNDLNWFISLVFTLPFSKNVLYSSIVFLKSSISGFSVIQILANHPTNLRVGVGSISIIFFKSSSDNLPA
jgi:hypothetical protein